MLDHEVLFRNLTELLIVKGICFFRLGYTLFILRNPIFSCLRMVFVTRLSIGPCLCCRIFVARGGSITARGTVVLSLGCTVPWAITSREEGMGEGSIYYYQFDIPFAAW